MADHQSMSEIKQFRRELEKSDLDDKTIDVLIDMGFRKVSHLRHLPKKYIENMENLNQAQKFILIGEIDEKWKRDGHPLNDSVGSSEESLRGDHSKCKIPSETSIPHKQEEQYRKNTEESNEKGYRYDQSDYSKRSTENNEKKQKWRDSSTCTAENRQQSEDSLSDSGKNLPHQSSYCTKQSQTFSDTFNKQSTHLKNPKEDCKSSKMKLSNTDSDKTKFAKSHNSDTDRQELEIEEIQRSSSPVSHIIRSDDEDASCKLAKRYFTEGDYNAMEKVLSDIDQTGRSSRGRIRFGVMLLEGNYDFSDVYDCVNLQTNDAISMHEIIRQQFSNFADSHQILLRQLELQDDDSTFSEWAAHTPAVFRVDSDLEYGSSQWERFILKTEQLARFFSKLKTPAKNISKSFILLILHVVNRAWLIRNRALPSDLAGLLRISTFCLPLCESDLVASTYFCELMQDVYANATMTLGLNIDRAILEIELFHDQFSDIKSRLELFYNQCLHFAINPRNEDVDEKLEKITDAVELKWAMYLQKVDQEPGFSMTSGHDLNERDQLAEDYVEKIIKLCKCRSFSEVTKEISEAEDVLQETGFKLKIGCLISSTYKQAFDSMSLPADFFGNGHALFVSLRDKLVGLVIDCKEMLQEMKIYSNDAMAKWVDLFFEFYFFEDCMYGSLKWQETITLGQTAVDDIPRGINPNGRTTIQLYIQLITLLIRKALINYKNLVPGDRMGHLRLSCMYLTIVKCSLLNSKWYLSLRHDAHKRNVTNMGVCILNGDVLVDIGVYEQFRNMKRLLDKITIDCQKLRISTGIEGDNDEVNRIYEAIEKKVISSQKPKQNYRKMEGFEVNEIGGNDDVNRIVSSAIDSFHKMNFNEMTVRLDEAEIFDSCNIRLAFGGVISPGFHQVVIFSNNIPETRGLEIVHNTTYVNLQNLARDHQKIATYMEEEKSSTFYDLVEYLFQQKGIMPCTDKWDCMLRKAQAVVTYFESLSQSGQCVTKCYIQLFLTVLHNYMATRNRLHMKEHFQILPFVFACIPFCESELIASDAWVKTRSDVYEISVLKTGSSLAAGQISCALWFPRHLQILDELEKKASELDILVCTQKQQLMIAREQGTNLYRGSIARMCISAAHFYFGACLYKGMIAILEAADQTEDAVDIRMNFAIKLSSDFELCVDQHNTVSNAESLSQLVSNSKFVLEFASNDHSNILRQMCQSSENHLLTWVGKILDNIKERSNGEMHSFDSSAWQETEKLSLLASDYILNLSEGGRCISQAYLSFFMSFCMNFISTRHRFIEDDFMGELQMILAAIKLCKQAFVTSNFSVRLKNRACSLAALLFTRVTDFDERTLKEIRELVKEVRHYKQLTKEYDAELLKRGEKYKDVIVLSEESVDARSQARHEGKAYDGREKTVEIDKSENRKEHTTSPVLPDNCQQVATEKESKEETSEAASQSCEDAGIKAVDELKAELPSQIFVAGDGATVHAGVTIHFGWPKPWEILQEALASLTNSSSDVQQRGFFSPPEMLFSYNFIVRVVPAHTSLLYILLPFLLSQ